MSKLTREQTLEALRLQREEKRARPKYLELERPDVEGLVAYEVARARSAQPYEAKILILADWIEHLEAQLAQKDSA